MLVADMEKFISPRSGGRMFRIHNFSLVLLLIGYLMLSTFSLQVHMITTLCMCLLAETWFFFYEKGPVAHALVEVVEASDVKPSDLNG